VVGDRRKLPKRFKNGWWRKPSEGLTSVAVELGVDFEGVIEVKMQMVNGWRDDEVIKR
jgi:hypothetical protein